MHLLYVDTENYSGNFERNMAAFATGQIGDCGRGWDFAETAQKEMAHAAWWKEHIVQEEDEKGSEFYRPVKISPTPGWYNNGRGLHFRADSEEAEQYDARCPAYLSIVIKTDEKPPQEVWEEFQERLIEFCDSQQLTLVGVRQEEVLKLRRKRSR